MNSFGVSRFALLDQLQTLNSKHRTRFLFLAFCFLTLSSCTSKPESQPQSSTKFQQYFLKGEELYQVHCSNCHQKNGTGLGLVFPPLSQSDYVDRNIESVLCLMRNGIEGELLVNGKSFNKKMPGIPSLTDLEIAEIATFVYNSWGRQGGMVEVSEASKILSRCDSISVNR